VWMVFWLVTSPQRCPACTHETHAALVAWVCFAAQAERSHRRPPPVRRGLGGRGGKRAEPRCPGGAAGTQATSHVRDACGASRTQRAGLCGPGTGDIARARCLRRKQNTSPQAVRSRHRATSHARDPCGAARTRRPGGADRTQATPHPRDACGASRTPGTYRGRRHPTSRTVRGNYWHDALKPLNALGLNRARRSLG